jgi:hypothetical protein
VPVRFGALPGLSLLSARCCFVAACYHLLVAGRRSLVDAPPARWVVVRGADAACAAAAVPVPRQKTVDFPTMASFRARGQIDFRDRSVRGNRDSGRGGPTRLQKSGSLVTRQLVPSPCAKCKPRPEPAPNRKIMEAFEAPQSRDAAKSPLRDGQDGKMARWEMLAQVRQHLRGSYTRCPGPETPFEDRPMLYGDGDSPAY